MDLDLDAYPFRVPLPAHLPQMHFQSLNEAKAFAEACLDATCVQVRVKGAWRVLWQDGELVSRRDGFFVLEPWLGQGKR